MIATEEPMLRWLTVGMTAVKLGINRATLYRWAKSDPDFPQPSYALGENNPRYHEGDIDNYMRQALRERNESKVSCSK